MVGKIKKWGNSLALRIPRALAAEAGIADNSLVEVRLKGSKLLISGLPEPDPSLEDLLKKVSRENLHGEEDSGPAKGREAW